MALVRSVSFALLSAMAVSSVLIACSDRDEPRFRPVGGAGQRSGGDPTPTEPTGHGTAERAEGGRGSEDRAADPGLVPPAGDIPAPPDVAAPPPDAQRTPSGLASKVLQPGTGNKHPRPEDRVTVHYTGWTKDGRMFDSSLRRGRPATFRLDGLIPGWIEGLQLMVEGERRRFWIPEELAYRGRPGAPQGMLVFDVELIRILEGPGE
jgi:peptidylprolyl isomerase